MNDFIAGLQFLTRLHLVKEVEWSSESFGRSVKYFPIVGAIIGIILALAAAWGKQFFSIQLLTLIIIIINVIVTGGLHCDGLMDTADGIFSGRSRERMLEIMKDSCVGANGVLAILLVVLGKWSILQELPVRHLPIILFGMPIIGRMAMVTAITLFPYARPEGIGKLFAQYVSKSTLAYSTMLTVLLLLLMEKNIILAAAMSMIPAYLFCTLATKRLGGLTGDVYGAVTEITELFYLFSVYIIYR